jgi:hypothetical protein
MEPTRLDMAGKVWLDKVRLLVGQARQSCRARMPEKENPRGGFVATANQQKYRAALHLTDRGKM